MNGSQRAGAPGERLEAEAWWLTKDLSSAPLGLHMDAGSDCSTESTSDSACGTEQIRSLPSTGATQSFPSSPTQPGEPVPPAPSTTTSSCLGPPAAETLPSMVSLPSTGSALHASGRCTPCAWVWKAQGCANGRACQRCHLCPQEEIKLRKTLKLAALRTKATTSGNQGPEAGGQSDGGECRSWAVGPIRAVLPRTLPALQSPGVGEVGPVVPPPPMHSPKLGMAGLAGRRLPPPPAQVPAVTLAGEQLPPPPSHEPALSPPGLRAPATAPWVQAPPGLALPPGLPPPPMQMAAPATALSLGSHQHLGGECVPCAWFWKPQGCRNVEKCHRCHLCPPGALKTLKRAKLAAMRQTTADVEEQEEEGSLESLEFAWVEGRQQADPRKCDDDVATAALVQDADSKERRAPASAAAEVRPPPVEVVEQSFGSALHASGKCSPCAWFWKPQGCQNGGNCSRCHLCTEGEVKARKAAKKAALRGVQAVQGGA
jgi:hypothetical protein